MKTKTNLSLLWFWGRLGRQGNTDFFCNFESIFYIFIGQTKFQKTVRLIEKVRLIIIRTDFCNRIINEGKDVKCFGPLYLIFELHMYVITAFSFSTINSHRISMQL